MNLVQLSGVLPRDPQFREWLCDLASVDSVDVDQAAEFIRVICEVDSRRELARDASAAHRFENLVRRPFVAWRDNQQH